MTWFYQLLLLIYVLSVYQSVQANELMNQSKFLPARIGDGPNALTQNLQCPDRVNDEDSILVICQATIKSTGKAEKTYCVTKEHKKHREYRKNIESAFSKSKFLPASVNDENMDVFISFRILFEKNESDCSFIFIPNLGFNEDELGLNYIAPQEILIKNSTWSDRVKLFGIFKDEISKFRTGLLFSISTLVSTSGNASDAKIESNPIRSKLEAKRSLRGIVTSKFIPGFYKGVPYEMRYYDVLYAVPGN